MKRLLAITFLVMLAPFAARAQTVIPVAAGQDLQAAINAARCGDTLSVAAGATFTGNFSLGKMCPPENPISIVSSRRSELPAGVRVTPADAAKMPRLVTPNTESVIRTTPGASGYVLAGLELTHAGQFLYDLVAIGDPSAAQNTQEKIPHHFVLDRLYVHTTEAGEVIRGLDINADDVQVINSHVSGFKSKQNADTQAILTFSCNGRHLIENNYLEAAGENYISGGADAKIQGMVPSDITIRRNHFYKPMAWRGVYGVKNLIEFKNVRRARIEGNLFENVWASGQAGYAVVITPRNQEGTNPWATVEDVDFVNNHFRNSARAVQVLGQDDFNCPRTEPHPNDPCASRPTKGVRFNNNLWENIGAFYSNPGLGNKLIEIGTGTGYLGASGVEFNRNTFSKIDSEGLYLYGEAHPGLAVRSSVGITGGILSDVTQGLTTLAKYAPGAIVTDSVFVAVNRCDFLPAGNSCYATEAEIPPSTTRGVDLAALRAAMGGASPTPSPTATPSPTPIAPTPTPTPIAPTPTPTPTQPTPSPTPALPQPSPTPTAPTGPAVARIGVTFTDGSPVDAYVMARSSSVQFVAKAYDAAGREVKPAGTFAWSSSSNSVLTVTTAGKITSKKWAGVVYVELVLSTEAGLLSKRIQVTVR